MSNLRIGQNIISNDIENILRTVKASLRNGKLAYFRRRGQDILVTCPFHKEGLEKNPSCRIYVGEDTEDIKWGTFNCFSCGAKGHFTAFIAACFDKSPIQAEIWLKEHFTEDIDDTRKIALEDPIILKKDTVKYYSEDILENFEDWHPYLHKRGLTREVCKKFDVKYDPKTKTVVFPVRDKLGAIKLLTRRSIEGKFFNIEEVDYKGIFLLYNVLQDRSREVYITESQIDALTLQQWGYPAVALLGTGSKENYEELNNTNILCFNLCFDGDDAGMKGIKRFMDNVKGLKNIIRIPQGKDVNDLTKEQFDKLVKDKIEVVMNF